MNTIALLLLQVSMFQSFVDEASRRLNVPPITVIETTNPGPNALASTNGTVIYVHPLLSAQRKKYDKRKANAMRWSAYHEVCHIALRHRYADLTPNQRILQENGADACAFGVAPWTPKKMFQDWSDWSVRNQLPKGKR